MTAALALSTKGEEETRALGERLGRLLDRGDVVLLQGELGTGKTRLVQGLGRGLGCEGRINSPTFVLVNAYPGRVSLYHADLYRLGEGADVDELGLWDHAEAGVLAVEWPERAGGALPVDGLLVRFERGARDDERRVAIEGLGERGRLLLARLEAA